MVVDNCVCLEAMLLKASVKVYAYGNTKKVNIEHM